jgi:signal peptidase I
MFNKPKNSKKRKTRKISKRSELIKAAILIILIAAALRAFIVFPFRMNNDAMLVGFYPGDHVLTSKMSYEFKTPERGDIVVFDHPFRAGEKAASRIIATEGQMVEIVGKMVYVDGEAISEPITIMHSDYRILPPDFSNRDYSPPQQVPPAHVYVLGDNRDQSEDSRDFGFVRLSSIRGKVLFVYFSWAPDPNAPRMESPYIIPAIQIVFYNLFHFPTRVRWDRFLAGL